MLRVRVAARTDRGRQRPHNEDSLLLADPFCRETGDVVASHVHPIGPCVLVAGVFDGMGGAAAGEVASSLAAGAVLRDLFDEAVPAAPGDLASRLKDALEDASDVIADEARRDRELRGMGTTGTLAGFADGTLVVAHVGDSRAYLLREGTITQVTRDHSLVAHLVAQGTLAPEEVEAFPYSHVLLQALGVSAGLNVAVSVVPLAAGDRVLLCTDGLTNVLSDAILARIVAEARDPDEACRALVANANLGGGPDNVTAVVAALDDEEPKPKPTLPWVAALAVSLFVVVLVTCEALR